jgi:hypothetical protein
MAGDAEYASAPMMAEGNYSSPQPHQHAAVHHPVQAHHGEHAAAAAFEPGKAQLNYEGPAVVYRDLWALVLFVLHLVGMLVLAGVYGPSLISDINSSPPSSQPAPATEKKETSDNMFIALLVVAGVIGVAFSLFWLGVMKRYSSQIIKISLGASVLLAVLATIAAFAAGQVLMGRRTPHATHARACTLIGAGDARGAEQCEVKSWTRLGLTAHSPF